MVDLTMSSPSSWVEITLGRPACAVSAPCQAMASAVVLSAWPPPTAAAICTISGTACTTLPVARRCTISASGSIDHRPSEHSSSTSPGCRLTWCDSSILGALEAPRQLYSLLRSGWVARSFGSARPRSTRYSKCEWSRVRASTWLRRTQYRRESPAWAHTAQLCCTRQATTVVRGISGRPWVAA